jgi:ABC-type multidrug transport system fused ATPase/permease subunit
MSGLSRFPSAGSGKSTIVKLLQRFFDPTRGTILLDGRPLKDYRLSDLRRAIAAIDQDISLMSRSVIANVLLGCHPDEVARLTTEATDAGYAKSTATEAGEDPDEANASSERAGPNSSFLPCPSLERLIHASKLARCHDFIMSLPEGYATELGEKGGRLSGGERQRLSILRAILRDSPIVCEDEATGSLDAQSEKDVSSAMTSLLAGRTSLVITHRLTGETTAKSDCVYAMRKGEIIESGKHHELMKVPNGYYRSLVEIQRQGGASDASSILSSDYSG